MTSTQIGHLPLTTVKERWPDCDIAYLVYEEAGSFVVYVDSDIDVDWETTENYDLHSVLSESEHNTVLNEAAIIESIPCDYLDSRTRLRFKRQIGEAMARSFSHDYRSAHQMLAAAREYVIARNMEKSRYWYLTGSALTTLALAALVLLVWTMRNAIQNEVWARAGVGMLVTFTGALGAMLSIILRMGKSVLDCASGRALHYVEAASRIAAGALSATVLFVAAKAGLLLPMSVQQESEPWGLVLIAFVAGASERLAPSVISSVEQTMINEHRVKQQRLTNEPSKETMNE